ncbi:hypothetical protein [Marinomonas fungiae]|uniref:Uncharacterized protein n=1 Tax=Marinomonas fungiae TaxID=1137284 RepID=A0A0K6IL55_9GAMM|nr:hypothetical protein [Marinomonas fungiae]CUB03840.1 hypothetical protein Ga0061065_104271 [Marinomonas fungiae]
MFRVLITVLVTIVSLLDYQTYAAAAEVDSETGKVELNESVSMTGTAVATWERHQLDDEISYNLRLYLVVDASELDTRLVEKIPNGLASDEIVINLNYLDYGEGRLEAIRTIFGTPMFDTISHEVGTYQKFGTFTIDHLMTIVECDHRDFYADFRNFKSKKEGRHLPQPSLDLGCS